MAQDGYTDTEVLCEGYRMQGGKLYIGFRPLAALDDGAVTTSLFSAGRSTKGYRAGAIYKLPCKLDEKGSLAAAEFGKYAFSSYAGMVKPDTRAAALRIASDAAEAEQKAKRTYLDDSSTKEVLKGLSPLRELYRQTNLTGRRAIEVTVLEYLRRGD